MFEIGKQYLLVLPKSWKKRDRSCGPWHNQIVTYYKTGDDMEEVNPDHDWAMGENREVGPFTAWVKHPNPCITTGYIGNVFLAKPEWLKELYVSPFTEKLT